MYCSTHSTHPLISKPSFLGCLQYQGAHGIMHHMARRSGFPADPVVQHHGIRPTGRAVGREDLVAGGYFHWGDAPIKKACLVTECGEIAMFCKFPTDLWWVSEFLNLGWSTEWRMTSYFFSLCLCMPKTILVLGCGGCSKGKKCRDIETSKQDNPWCCCFLVAGGVGANDHMEQEHACLLLPATEPAAFLRKLKVQVFPSPCGAGQNKALDWLKLLPSNSEVFFKGGLSRKSFFQLPTPKVAGAKWQNKCWWHPKAWNCSHIPGQKVAVSGDGDTKSKHSDVPKSNQIQSKSDNCPKLQWKTNGTRVQNKQKNPTGTFAKKCPNWMKIN